MRKIVILLTLALLFTVTAAAQEQDAYGAWKLKEGLNPQQQALLSEASPTQQTDFFSAFFSMLVQTVAGSESAVKKAASVLGGILAVMILCAMAERFSEESSQKVTQIAGVFAITILCTRSMSGMLGLASQTASELRAFEDLLLPVLSGALTASGAPTAAAGLYAGTVLFMDVLQRILSYLFTPLVYGYLALSCAECAMQENIGKLREFVGFLITVGLKGVTYLFTAYLAITEIIGKSADAAALKAAKATLSAAIPVVGSTISGAGESILAGAQMLKNTAGVFGMLALISIGIAPFLEIGIHYLALKLGTAVGGAFGKDGCGKMVQRISEAMGFMLAICGCGILMALVSCCCFLRSANA